MRVKPEPLLLPRVITYAVIAFMLYVIVQL